MQNINNDELLINYVQNINSSHRTINMILNVLTQQERNYNNIISLTRERNRDTRRINNNNRNRIQETFSFFPSIQRNHHTRRNTRLRNNMNNNLINNSLNYTTFNNINNPINNTCPITHEQFTANDNVIQIIPCGHIFNETSLLRWLETNSTCPMCRYNLLRQTTINNRQNTQLTHTSQLRDTILPNDFLNIISETIVNEINNLNDLSSNITSDLSGNISSDLSRNISSDLSRNISSDLSGNYNEISFILPILDYTINR